MFNRARVKLTLCYLLIIMLVSVAFSTVIYRTISGEIERFSRLQRFRFERQVIPPPPEFEPELIMETKQRVLVVLVLINSSILFFSGVLGYILAGQTLKPIQEMVKQQHQFISDSSHELRTPITALKSVTEVALRDKQLSIKTAKAALRDTLFEINQLQSLSERLLLVSQEGALPQDKLHLVSLADEVKQAINSIMPLAKQKQIKIEANLKTKKRVRVFGDSLSQLISILLENAVQYSNKKSHIEVSVRVISGTARIAVKDQGQGISAEDLPRIFDRFYRADTSRETRKDQGFGLGLSIAQNIAQRHHWRINVQSQLKKGSTFTLELPLS